ncbi:uncharacterized protein LOC129759270 [Uranotaenia lowii]|uniref:uncharacterized protein LOC129759270 n=1 Tax=Uranotaenia lowii TaxID=190385 RepID=UPI00247A757E|nr:uncharacterized protein LOC129759270 [Uranotaenia lowii]
MAAIALQPTVRLPKQCRACLAQDNDDLVSVQLIQEGVTIRQMIQELTGIEVSANKNLPQNVCLMCLDRLRNAYKLRLQFLESEQILCDPTERICSTIEQKANETGIPGIVQLEIQTLVSNESNEYDKMDRRRGHLSEFDQMSSNLTEEENSPMGVETRHQTREGKLYLEHELIDYEVLSQTDFYNHIRFHPYPCCGCYERFSDRNELYMHGLQVHASPQDSEQGISTEECPVCFKKFVNRQAVLNHRNILDGNRFHCMECDVLLETRKLMLEHIEHNHAVEVYEDELSKYDGEDLEDFHAENNWVSRNDSNYGLLEPLSLLCCGCNEVFSARKDLEEHSRKVHLPNKTTNEKALDLFPIECSICYERFDNDIHLFLHRVAPYKQNIEDSKEDIRKKTLSPPCRGCKELFHTYEDIQKNSQVHYARKIANLFEGMVPRKFCFECITCYERFDKQWFLMLHRIARYTPLNDSIEFEIDISPKDETPEMFKSEVLSIAAVGLDEQSENEQEIEFIEDFSDNKQERFDSDNFDKSDEYLHSDDDEATGISFVETRANKYLPTRQRKEMGRVPGNVLRIVEQLKGYNIVEILKERCCFCLKFFDSVEVLDLHVVQHHRVSLNEIGENPVRYQCEYCLRNFNIALLYVVHKRIREQKQFYQCRLCDFVIDNVSRLKNHMLHNEQHAKYFNLVRHDVSDQYEIVQMPGKRCCGCDNYFDNTDSLAEHSLIEHPRDPLKDSLKRTVACKICDKRFYTKTEMEVHQKKQGSTTRFNCKLCDFSTPSKARMLKHLYSSIHNQALSEIQVKDIKSNINKAGTLYYCCFEGCKLAFHTTKLFNDHIEKAHSKQKAQNIADFGAVASDRLQCEHCFRVFRTLTHLKQHRLHDKMPKKFVCAQCGISKSSKASLKVHEMLHTGERPYHCKICDKRFTSQTILSSHLKCHAPKQYQCNDCGEKFARGENLKRHIRHRHAEATFSCNYCPRKMKTREAQLQHERSHTGEKPFECRTAGCSKRYASITDRRRHEMLNHTGERPHCCSFCSASFVRKRQLTVHERKHTGERPFACQRCGKSFIDAPQLKKHTCYESVKNQSIPPALLDVLFSLPFEMLREVPIPTLTTTGKQTKIIIHRFFLWVKYKVVRSMQAECRFCTSTGVAVKLHSEADVATEASTKSTWADIIFELAAVQITPSDEDNDDVLCLKECVPRLRDYVLFRQQIQKVEATRNMKRHPRSEEGYDMEYLDDEQEMCDKHGAHIEEPSDETRLDGERMNLSNELILTQMHFDNFDYFEFAGVHCCGCDTIARNEDELLVHAGNVHRPRTESIHSPYCSVCKHSFPATEDVERHRNQFSQNIIFYCKLCQRRFMGKEAFTSHIEDSLHRTQDDQTKHADLDNTCDVLGLEVSSEQIVVPPPVEGQEVEIEYCDLNYDKSKENIGLPDPKLISGTEDQDHYQIIFVEDAERCCVCGIFFQTYEALLDHARFEHHNGVQFGIGQDKNMCEICHVSFKMPSALNAHRTHSRFTKRMYHCKICQQTYNRKFHLIRHFKSTPTHHDALPSVLESFGEPQYKPSTLNKNGDAFACCFLKCSLLFNCESDLANHVLENHAPRRKLNDAERTCNDFLCPVCLRSFSSQKLLQFHRNRSLKKRHICSFCAKSFLIPSELHEHELLVHSENIQRHLCDICHKAFRTVQLMKNHRQTHKQERNFGCNQCSASFQFRFQLRKHMNAVHPTSFPYECSFCEKKFSTKSKHDLHRRSHTGERPYHCRFEPCTKKFSHVTDRKRHEMGVHTGERPYRCEHCPAAYIRKRELVLHGQKHC